MEKAGFSGAANGGQLEEKIDFSEEVKPALEEAEATLKSDATKLQEVLATLMGLEKKCRMGNDIPSLTKVCTTCLQHCHDYGGDSEKTTIETLQVLVTRRSQKSRAVSAMVEVATPWTNDESFASNEKLVEALRNVTDGKLYLEAERARLTLKLAQLRERNGDIAGAASCLQEVHVETYGSLSKSEKVDYLLQQIRLTLQTKDYVRVAIVVGKIQRRVLSEEGMESAKIQFYTLLQQYHLHQQDAWELANDYHHIYSTRTVQEDEVRWMNALRYTVLYLMLSPYNNEQQDMMNRISLDPKLEKLPEYKETLDLFLKKEIMHYPTTHQAKFFDLLTTDEEMETGHWETTFHKRIVQHNIRIASLYYTRIHGSRLAQLLGLDAKTLEKEIAGMVSDGTVYAKIDRPKDIVRFARPKSPEEILSDWGSDIKKLLDLVETTTHLIHKENMTQ